MEKRISPSSRNEWENYISKNPFKNILEASPSVITPERQEFMDWYFTQVDKLKDFEQKPAPITDEKDWQFKLNDDGSQVESIGRRDENFWKITGRRNKVGDFEWGQPVKESIEIPMRIKLFGKEMTMPVFGILIATRDTDGRYLMTVGQETTSDFYKKAMVRLPIQGSQGKLDQIFNKGNENADPNLEKNLKIITGRSDLSPKELIEFALSNGDFSFPIGADDSNFEVKHNVASVWTVKSGSEKHKKLEETGVNKFLTLNQIKFATAAMLTNGHSERVLGMIPIHEELLNSR